MSDWRASNFKEGDKFTFDCPCCGEIHEGTVGKHAPIQCDSKSEIIEITPELKHIEAIDAKCVHCIKLNREGMLLVTRTCSDCDTQGYSNFCPNCGEEMIELPMVCLAKPGKCPLQDVSVYYKASQ